MRAEVFVDLIRAAAPPRFVLIEHGLDGDEIDEISNIYACPRREHASRAAYPDELQRLLGDFDCRFELAAFRFLSPPSGHLRGLCIVIWRPTMSSSFQMAASS